MAKHGSLHFKLSKPLTTADLQNPWQLLLPTATFQFQKLQVKFDMYTTWLVEYDRVATLSRLWRHVRHHIWPAGRTRSHLPWLHQNHLCLAGCSSNKLFQRPHGDHMATNCYLFGYWKHIGCERDVNKNTQWTILICGNHRSLGLLNVLTHWFSHTSQNMMRACTCCCRVFQATALLREVLQKLCLASERTGGYGGFHGFP